MPPVKRSRKLSNLKNLVGSSRDIIPLGKWSRVGGFSWVVHAGIFWIEKKLKGEVMRVFETLKGDSSSLETNRHIIENFACMAKDSLTFKGESCHPADVNHTGWKYAPHRRTLSRSRLWPNVVRKMPLVGGLCHTADFGQRWSKNVPLVGELCHAADFDQMWPKKSASCRRTLSHCGLWPNVVQKCAPCQRTFSRYGL